MNLLKELTITGHLHPTHARLTLEYVFANEDTCSYSPRYLFPIPEDAGITGFQILTRDKTLLRAKIQPLADTDSGDYGFRLVQLEPCLYSLEWESLPPGESCTILVECILRLLPCGGHCRLVLPLGFSLPSPQPFQTNCCPATVDLSLDGLEPLYSLCQFDPNTRTLSCQTETGRDLVLDFTMPRSNTLGLLQEDLGQGLGLYRIYAKDPTLYQTEKKQRVQLLLDLGGIQSERKTNAVKELFFRVLSTIPPKMPIRLLTTNPEASPSWDTFRLASDTLTEEVFLQLQTLSGNSGHLEEMLQRCASVASPHDLILCISGGSTTLSKPLPSALPMHLFTIGKNQQTPLFRDWQHLHLGSRTHFYPTDSLENRLSALLPRLLYDTDSEQILPEGSTVHDFLLLPGTSLAADGYRDIVLAYSGHPPCSFSLWKSGEEKEISTPSDTTVFPRLPEAEQLYAMAKTEGLSRLLQKTAPVSIRAIKEQLAKTGTRFQLLNSETLLTIQSPSTHLAGIPLQCLSSVSDGLGELSHRPTIFGEGTRSLPKVTKENLSDLCRKVLYHSIRSNGAIFGDGCTDLQKRTAQTTLAFLALSLDSQDAVAICRDALLYLDTAPPSRWSSLLHAYRTNALSPSQLRDTILKALPDPELLLPRLSGKYSDPEAAALLLLYWNLH